MARALKVFRTPIGFHDAYIATPSQKAALKAWGAEVNLFARGAAEEVTDESLMRAPLAQPGTVIRVKRGTDAEHFAALAPDDAPARPKRDRPAPTRSPRPDRSAVDRADAALETAGVNHDRAIAAIAAREARLREERQALEQAHAAEVDKLEAARRKTRKSYAAKLERWADNT